MAEYNEYRRSTTGRSAVSGRTSGERTSRGTVSGNTSVNNTSANRRRTQQPFRAAQAGRKVSHASGKEEPRRRKRDGFSPGIAGILERIGLKAKENGHTHYYDYGLLFIVLMLICFGLVMLYSTSSYNALEQYENAAYYLNKQIFSSVLGIAAMLAISNIDYHFWEKFALLGYVVSIILIFLVLTPIGRESHGARRWIGIGPLSIQPAEVAKLAIILFLAYVISKAGKQLEKNKTVIIVIGITAVVAGTIAIVTDNLSTAIIIMGIGCVMIFVATPRIGIFLAAGILAVLAVAALLVFGDGFRMERIAAWRDPEGNYSKTGYQILQGLYAIGSGGLFGKGLGNSVQKLGFVPEAQNDMIFSIICEELGLFGALCVITLFGIMIWRFMIIANNANDLFGSMLVVGVMAHIAIQVILNIAVVTNSMPNTGVTLPFISYGGTSVLFLLAEMGLVLSVAKQIDIKN